MELIPEMAALGLLGTFAADRIRLRGHECGQLWPDLPGTRARRFGHPQFRLGAILAVHVSDLTPMAARSSAERWLPDMAAGKVIGCFGLTEPQGGSDPANMKTHAKKDGGDWILNGAKMWITNGNLAHIAIVWAMTEDGIQGFLVEKDMSRIQRAGNPQEDEPARVGDLGAVFRQRARAGSEPPA